jgi:hypothetical protein
MARIICLANSWKRSERCIAGIDLDTGGWVRPVTEAADGSVPRHIRALRKGEPALLDILELPLASGGPDFGFECENRLILPGRWYVKGQARHADLRRYVVADLPLLHTEQRYVTVAQMQALPSAERRTLQLVETTDFAVQATRRQESGHGVWKGSFSTAAGYRLTANITDPAFSARLDVGHAADHHCLLTISLSLPWRPPDWTRDDDPCWKLIAGVIELSPHNVGLSRAELAAVPF